MAEQLLAPSIYSGGNPNVFNAPPPVYYQTPQGPQPSQGNMFNSMPNFSGFKPMGNGFTTALNKLGTNIGFAPSSSGLVYSGMGPAALPWAQPGMAAPSFMAGAEGVSAAPGAFGASTLSGALGAAGIGAFAGNFLGKIGGNKTGGSIGGGVGAGIGMAVGGPVGAVVGGLIGGIAGGFFGSGKPSAVVSEYAGTVSGRDGYGKSSSFGTKGASTEFAQALNAEMNYYLKGAADNLNMDFKPVQMMGGYNSKYGSYLKVGGTFYWFNNDDVKSKNAAIDGALSHVATNSGASKDQVAKMIAGLNGKGGATATYKPSDPNIPDKAPPSYSSFQQFLEKYKADYGPKPTTTN